MMLSPSMMKSGMLKLAPVSTVADLVATKSATVETGASFNIPLFIIEGDSIKVDTSTGDYVVRSRK